MNVGDTVIKAVDRNHIQIGVVTSMHQDGPIVDWQYNWYSGKWYQITKYGKNRPNKFANLIVVQKQLLDSIN